MMRAVGDVAVKGNKSRNRRVLVLLINLKMPSRDDVCTVGQSCDHYLLRCKRLIQIHI